VIGTVAIEQGGADQADDSAAARATFPAGHCGLKSSASSATMPPFAAVVGAQNQQRIFERDDQDQRPKDQRHHAKNRLRNERPAMGGGLGRFLQRVERTGADVAIDDAKGSDRCRPWKGVGMQLKLGLA